MPGVEKEAIEKARRHFQLICVSVGYIGQIRRSFVKTLSTLFWIIAVLLSDVMCGVVAYNFCDMKWGIKYAGYSAPASAAFLTAIPFAMAIVVCIVLALFFRKKAG